jgi:hypothetical protein
MARIRNQYHRHSQHLDRIALLGRGEQAGQRALNDIATGLRFPLLGVDSDNGSEFINWHLKGWCEQQHIHLTQERPYKKDDNAPTSSKRT